MSDLPVARTHPERNLSLDFFRGLALVVIFINHMPFNPWYWATPSRFGASDATEIFIFISGFVSALVYGRRLDKQGWAAGTGRLLHRCGEIYFAHIFMFALLAVICYMGTQWLAHDYIAGLNLWYAFDNPNEALLGLLTLSYVPNYFDILPMYFVLLLMIPIIWRLAQVHRALAMLAPMALYAASISFGWELTADVTNGRPWYFNPLCWQLLFFTGFAFGAGYLPRVRWNWIVAFVALAIVSASAVIEFGATFFNIGSLWQIRHDMAVGLDKSHLGLLRYVHLLALVYLVGHAAARFPRFTSFAPAQLFVKLGQQSLPAFVVAMVLSYVGGMALDYWGREALPVAIINISGLILLFGSAYVAAGLRKPVPAVTPAMPVLRPAAE